MAGKSLHLIGELKEMITVPVFSDENGTPHISMYVEDEDGTFRRTQNEPLRLLRDDIKGISISQGDIVTPTYDRYDRKWSTPTVTFHYGRPQSFYQFLRSKVPHNRFFVFTKPQLSGHISRLSLHELQLKNSVSQRKVAILKEKYVEAVELWSEEVMERLAKKKPPTRTTTAEPLDSRKSTDVHVIAESTEADDTERTTAKVAYFRRNNSPLENPQSSVPEKTLLTGYVDLNPVERDFNKRKNLIREFSLLKDKPRSQVEQKDHNKHFFKRFFSSQD